MTAGTAAVDTVLLYRTSTFYLPPLRGFVAMQWLPRSLPVNLGIVRFVSKLAA
ncbi:MAG: hypothetical protein ACRDPV_16145 [Gaiellaceae bacterium]